MARAEERLSFDVQPALAAQLGYVDAQKPRRAVEAFMRAYFLVAKDVGDLTRIFCAALEEQHRKPRPSLRRILPGFLKARSPDDEFYVENGRLTANPAIFRHDPANILRIQSRNVLYCAILLHDMAKGLPGDHSDVGAEIARSLCPRLGLSPADTAAVAWLVKHHLVMSDTAQRRDVSDPKTVRDFVEMVQSPEMLRELYYAAENMMTGGDQVPSRSSRVAAAKAALEKRLSDFTPALREQALNRHYDNYWLAFEEDELERHARLVTKADAEGRLLTL